jgi:hypothetical protein
VNAHKFGITKSKIISPQTLVCNFIFILDCIGEIIHQQVSKHIPFDVFE